MAQELTKELQASAEAPWVRLEDRQPERRQRVVVAFVGDDKRVLYQLGRWGVAVMPPGVFVWMPIPDANVKRPEVQLPVERAEELATPPPPTPPIKRKRGRPRKNPEKETPEPQQKEQAPKPSRSQPIREMSVAEQVRIMAGVQPRQNPPRPHQPDAPA